MEGSSFGLRESDSSVGPGAADGSNRLQMLEESMQAPTSLANVQAGAMTSSSEGYRALSIVREEALVVIHASKLLGLSFDANERVDFPAF